MNEKGKGYLDIHSVIVFVDGIAENGSAGEDEFDYH